MNCKVKNCPNKTGEGTFVGDICLPCHTILTTGRPNPTQSVLQFINRPGRITVLSRRLAQRFEPIDPCIMLSITDPGSRMAKLNFENKFVTVERFKFFDLEDLDQGMSDVDAIRIVETVLRWPNADVAVHCEAGISRSAGVAVALHWIFYSDTGAYYETHFPNNWVVDRVLWAFKLKGFNFPEFVKPEQRMPKENFFS